MNRADFRTFCNTHKLLIEDAGRDWHDAGVRGAYLCATILDEKDFDAIKSILDNDEAYLASAERKDGQGWFEHNGFGKIYATDAHGVAIEMANQYVRFLWSKDDISYHSTEDINKREKALADNPALENESETEHFYRVSEMQDDGWLTPLCVTEPGYWDCNGNNLMLSDIETTAGVWSYQYDNWQQRVILVLNEQDTDDDTTEND